MTEEIRTQGCKHDRNRQVLVHGFRRLKKRAEEEYLKTLTEELQEKRRTQEDEVWEEFEEHMCHGTEKKSGQPCRKDIAAQSRQRHRNQEPGK